MTATETALPDVAVFAIRRQAALAKILNPPGVAGYIFASDLCADGKRRKKVVKDAIAAGLVEQYGENLSPTPYAFESIRPVDVFPYAEWQKRYRYRDRNTHLPYFPVVTNGYHLRVEPGQAKTLLGDSGYTWHVVWSHLLDGHHHNDDGKMIFGPYTAETIHQGISDAVKANEPYRSRSDWTVCVSSTPMQDRAALFVKTDTLNELFAKNIPWIAEHVLGLDEDVAKAIPGNFVAASFFPGAKEYTPAEWEANANDSVERLLNRISEASRQLTALTAVQRKIAAMGGWTAFRNEAYTRFAKAYEEHLAKQANPEPTPEPEPPPSVLPTLEEIQAANTETA